MIHKESDLVLEISKNVNPSKWDEGFYQDFLDLIFLNREYQKDATETALRYLNGGEYKNLEQLAKENFDNNDIIRERFNNNFDSMLKDLDLSDKLSGTIDMATGSGKSYVMIAIALIMLASKKIDRVLVLVPSITIEEELTKKFKDIISNDNILKSLGSNFVAPEVLNGDSTIVENSIAIENRNAVYASQFDRNSIVDSLKGKGEKTLVLNDEVHHVYYSESNQWKSFINDERDNDIDFKYILGFTGTPYKRRSSSSSPNEYFSDVIFRYSLREAIENNYVKDIHYISKEDIPNDPLERWQIILNSHDSIYTKIKDTFGEKPITIIVTDKQNKADSQAKKFKEFLKDKRGITDEEVDNIVLSVHSGNKAALDRLKLKDVDNPGNPVEFIFSVSMLTEGWDVKRVFQIVPDEERAFNSKLLISQVLGRGLRRPNNWQSTWGIPTVIVFNHEKWSPNVKNIVDEILEIRKTITISVNNKSDYNFNLHNIKYKSESTVTNYLKMGSYNLWENGVKLPTDTHQGKSNITFTDVKDMSIHESELYYEHEIISPDTLAYILYHRFEDLEDTKLTEEYQNLWTIAKIKEMINESLEKSSNKVITKNLKNKFLASMGTIFREGAKSVSYETVPSEYVIVNTKDLPNETSDLLNFKKNKTLFYSDELKDNLVNDVSRVSFNEIIDTSNGFSQQKINNKYLFKTPQFGIIVTGSPEKEFLKRLVQKDISENIDSFIKSSDVGFYGFDYSWRKGNHQKNGQFNPDWFIKKGNIIVVVDTKDNSQIINPDTENIGKSKAAMDHFNEVNQYLKNNNIDYSYKFTFLTPKNYDVFFKTLISGDISNFRSELDIKLES